MRCTVKSEKKILKTETAWCKGCGFCVALCPTKVLTLEFGKLRVREESACVGCGQCQLHCPDYAIWLEG